MINDRIQAGTECVGRKKEQQNENMFVRRTSHDTLSSLSCPLYVYLLPYRVPPKLADTQPLPLSNTKPGENPNTLLRLFFFNTEGMKHAFSAFMDLEAIK